MSSYRVALVLANGLSGVGVVRHASTANEATWKAARNLATYRQPVLRPDVVSSEAEPVDTLEGDWLVLWYGVKWTDPDKARAILPNGGKAPSPRVWPSNGRDAAEAIRKARQVGRALGFRNDAEPVTRHDGAPCVPRIAGNALAFYKARATVKE